ncbi:hypothetical protein SRRS_23430 [Sporomusa rhizae]|uniref:flagellar hook-length control protein FliK n=1 Tax=Sporomusa rhizae TaxID=357999 RepID=UPI00352A6652
MNLALNLLSTKNSASPQTTPAPSYNKPKNEQKNNFSDTLSNAVSKQAAKQTIDDQEQTKPALPNMPLGYGKNSISSANDVVLPVTPDNPSPEAVKPEDNSLNQPNMDLTANINAGALVLQVMPLLQETTASENMTPAEQAISPIGASVEKDSQYKSILPVLPEQDKLTSESMPNNETTPNQTGQEQPVPANSLPIVQKSDMKSNEAAAANGILTTDANQTLVETVAKPVGSTKQSTQSVEVQGEAEGKAESAISNQSVVPGALARETKKDSTGGGHKENLFEAALLKEAKLQKIASVNNEAFPGHMIQGLDVAPVTSNNTPSVANTAEVQQPNLPADVHEVAKQIVEQTRLITKPQNTEMIIKLKPEHLGELTLRVVIENGAVNASFHSNNSEVRNIIEASLPQLKQDMSNSGLKVDNVSVYAGLSQFLPNHDQDRSSRQQIIKFTNKKAGKDFVEAIDDEMSTEKLTGNSETGVDYRI